MSGISQSAVSAVNHSRASVHSSNSSAAAAAADQQLAAPALPASIPASMVKQTLTSTASLPVPAYSLPSRGSRPKTYDVEMDIKGMSGVAPEDREDVSDLMFFALVIKCTDGRFSSGAFSRPKWWRVEVSPADYWLLLGGYNELDLAEIQEIYKWDPQPESSRSVVGVSIRLAPSNSNANHYDLTLAIRYRPKAVCARRLAISANEPIVESSVNTAAPVRSAVGGASKKRGLALDVGGVVQWIMRGSQYDDD